MQVISQFKCSDVLRVTAQNYDESQRDTCTHERSKTKQLHTLRYIKYHKVIGKINFNCLINQGYVMNGGLSLIVSK